MDLAALLPPEEPVLPADRSWSRRSLWILAALTLLAGALRLYKIGEWSFWIDEVHTLRDSILVSEGQFWHSAGTAKQPLSYLLVRWLAPLLPGAAEGSFRLIFAFFGILSVPLLAVVVRRMFSTGPALISAAILTLSPWHIFWSQNVRGYSLVLFLSLGTLGLFHLAIEKGKGPLFLLCLVPAALMMLTHTSSVFFVLALLAYIGCLRLGVAPWPKQLSATALLWLFIPLFFFLVWNSGILWSAFTAYVRAKETMAGSSLFHFFNTTLFFVRVPVIVAAFGGLFILWNQRSRNGLLLALLILVPFLCLAVVSFYARMTAQYAFFVFPAWLILAGYGGWEITRRLEVKGFGRGLVRALPVAMIIFELAAQDHLYFHYRHGERPRWREAAEYLQGQARPGDIIASTNVPSMEWYLNPTDPQVLASKEPDPRQRVKLIASWTMEEKRVLQKWVLDAEKTGKQVWLVLTEPEFQEMDPGKKWDTWLRARFHQVRRLPNWVGPKDMTVLVYRYVRQSREKQSREELRSKKKAKGASPSK